MVDAHNDAAQNDGVKPKTILIAGASGLIGNELTQRATAEGYHVRHLVRRDPAHPHEYHWDPSSGLIDDRALHDADVLVNLSGASLSKLPWGANYKKKIYYSRIDSTNTLVQALRRSDAPPRVFLSASAVGYYGNRPHEELTDSSAHGTGFLADVCVDWEAAAYAAPSHVRVITLRTGVVLSRTGGVLPLLRRIALLGGAGPLGSGAQYWPWISLRDHVAAQLHLVTSELSGPVDLVGTEQTQASELMRAVAHAVKRPYWLPAPRFALVALLGDAARELLLSDQRVRPQRLLDSGYTFQDPKLAPLLTELFKRR
ncbi:TIGR01777 family oxidoreductase [Lysinibacter sp. HNR]|uniref:TIGR01777 family oxidoreductase n=1 Tax=Lysinibacter sp. HNR TaxID=3031408 RepID=UPI0024359585|nr:TIGR01777 family oxidoreductase [Lysinibacter sp. HNR]WGD38262.1 TIGR01777 family oxidoreductase [Lysinibacter sp. HNR]